MAAIQEVVIYIHGVADYARGQRHDADYDLLAQGIRAAGCTDWPTRECRVEWGWSDKAIPTQVGHELLTEAQARFGRVTLKRVDAQRDFTLNPMRLALGHLRSLLMLGFSDMFYYTSPDGRNSVRRSVARQITDCLASAPDPTAPLSLTLVGHSAGSVIAFDLLFYLFWQGGENRTAGDQKKDHVFYEAGSFLDRAGADNDLAALRDLRDKAQAGALRLRRLFTFGSPVALLAYRSNAVLKILATGSGLDPAFQGLKSGLAEYPPLTGCRWINMWDKDDAISWPVTDLMSNSSELVVDQYVDVSDNPLEAHTAYWHDPKVHEIIARSW